MCHVEDKSLRRFGEKERSGLRPWVEALVETDRIIPQLDQRLHELTSEMELELLKIRVLKQYQALDEQTATPELGELEELEVFKMKCRSFGSSPEEMDELVETFLELRGWMEEKAQNES